MEEMCKLMNSAPRSALAVAARSSNVGFSSAWRVSTTRKPCRSSCACTARASDSVTSFSIIPLAPRAPGSVPPCPGSSTTMLRVCRGAGACAVGAAVCGAGGAGEGACCASSASAAAHNNPRRRISFAMRTERRIPENEVAVGSRPPAVWRLLCGRSGSRRRSATSGHIVSFVFCFVGEENALERSAEGAAGRFNFFRFLLGRSSFSHFFAERVRHCRIQSFFRRARKICNEILTQFVCMYFRSIPRTFLSVQVNETKSLNPT